VRETPKATDFALSHVRETSKATGIALSHGWETSKATEIALSHVRETSKATGTALSGAAQAAAPVPAAGFGFPENAFQKSECFFFLSPPGAPTFVPSKSKRAGSGASAIETE
jgi:hypothetical protein